MEQKTISLTAIGSAFVTQDPTFTDYYGELFSYIPPDPALFLKLLDALHLARETFPNRHPATVLVGRLAPLLTMQSHQVLVNHGGQLTIIIELNERKLPDHDYLAIISPVMKTGATTEYSLAYESIQFLRAFIGLFFGKLPFYTLIGDFNFNASGELSFHTPAFRRPMCADFLKIIELELATEISARLALQQNDYRERLQRASSFFERAMRHNDEAFRFTSYWIALEIIVGGTVDAIRKRLSLAYGRANKNFADEHLCFGEIAEIRRSLIHQGKFSVLRSYHERLLQLYFWDIVIHQIGLLPRQLSLALVRSGVIEEEQRGMAMPGEVLLPSRRDN